MQGTDLIEPVSRGRLSLRRRKGQFHFLHTARAEAVFGMSRCGLVWILLLSAPLVSAETKYFGVKLGPLRSIVKGLSGNVFFANESALQIVDLNIPADPELTPQFFFSTKDASLPARRVYQVLSSPGGLYSKPFDVDSLANGIQKARVIVVIPKAGKVAWENFGIATQKNWKYLAAVKLNKKAPEPFCCLSDETTPRVGIVGKFYDVATAPIVVLDSKTVLLPKFNFRGTAPPDGWIYAGQGNEINQDTGRKALVLGRDTPEKHCALHEDYNGSGDLVARLAEGQTVYDIDFLAVFCYQYSVDFGHVKVALDPASTPVPAFLPPVSQVPLKAVRPSPHC